MKFQIQCGEDEYRIVVMEHEAEVASSALVDYGIPAVVEYEGERYLAFIEDPESPDEDLGQSVYRLGEAQTTEILEDVAFDVEGEAQAQGEVPPEEIPEEEEEEEEEKEEEEEEEGTGDEDEDEEEEETLQTLAN